MRILIVKLSAIGDCLLASPVAEALRISIPDAHIGWAVHPHCAPVIRGNPNVNQIHLVPRKQFARGLVGVSRDLKSAKYDVAIDLQGLLKSALVSRVSGARRRLGPAEAREGAGLLYTEKVLRGIHQSEHVVAGYLRFATALGASWTEEPPMKLPFGEPELEHIDQLFRDSGIRRDSKIVVLNPSAGKVIKQWPPERFAAVGDALRERLGAQIIVTGAPADRPLADAIFQSLRGPAHDFVSKTNLNELAALLSQVDLFIGGDTGPMHIAQAAGTRVLALFGPTDPTILGPRNPKHRVHTLNLACSPCRHRECPIGRLCLENMASGDVADHAEAMLLHRS